MEHFDRCAALLLFSTAVKRVVDDALCDRLLAVDHQVVHEFGQNLIAKFGVRQDFAFFGGVTTLTYQPLLLTLGRFAPYFERRCLRSLTP